MPTKIISPDQGPWMVEFWKENARVVLQSDDFTHDVALIVTGDFATKEDMLTYAKALAKWMNSNMQPNDAQCPCTNCNDTQNEGSDL